MKLVQAFQVGTKIDIFSHRHVIAKRQAGTAGRAFWRYLSHGEWPNRIWDCNRRN